MAPPDPQPTQMFKFFISFYFFYDVVDFIRHWIILDFLVIWESAILTTVSYIVYYIGNDRRKSSKNIF